MRNRVKVARSVAALLGGSLLALSGQALADTCPTGSNVVYVSGSSAFKTALQAVQKVFYAEASTTIAAGVITNPPVAQIIYTAPGSCEGLQHFLGTGGGAATVDTSAASYVVPSGDEGTNSLTFQTCTFGDAGAGPGVPDIGVSDVYPATCITGYDTTINPVSATTQKDFLGPVQAMTFVQSVSAQQQHTISAEAAYMVFGFAAPAATPADIIAPWNTTGDIVVRKDDSGTLQMLGAAIGLIGSKWVQPAASGPSVLQATGTGDVGTKVSTRAGTSASDAEAAIGIMSTSGLVPAANTQPVVQPLAFQAKNQECSYYPSSAAGKYDLVNVRQGRYTVWGPEHLVTTVDGTGTPKGSNGNDAAVQAVISALTATSQSPIMSSDAGPQVGFTETEIGGIIDAISVPSVGYIPTCAMEVSRTSEVGPESSANIDTPCICRYEQSAGVPSNTTCTACTSDSGCSGSTPKCHYGYCEAK